MKVYLDDFNGGQTQFGVDYDEMYGGTGKDVLGNPLSGFGLLFGGGGDDYLFADSNFFFGKFYGGAGDDNLEGGINSNTDFLYGGIGNDHLIGSADYSEAVVGPDLLDGGAGRDSLLGLAGADTLFGGDGDESGTNFQVPSFVATPGLYGGDGNDLLDGGNGNDWIYGGAGANTLIGGFGNDTFFVDSASDTVVEYAGGGTDFVRTSVSLALSAAAEVENLHVADLNQVTALSLTGSDSANFIVGNAGDNLLKGLSGNDVLAGFHGNDRLEGGLGNDTIDAYVGDDVLAGGAGKDALKGGEGRDAFVFDTAPNASTNLDTIADFSHADDTIRIDNAVFKAAGKNGKLVKDAFVSAKKALDAEDRFIYDKASGALSYDADGTGKIAAIKIAILQNKVKIDHTDFLVI